MNCIILNTQKLVSSGSFVAKDATSVIKCYVNTNTRNILISTSGEVLLSIVTLLKHSWAYRTKANRLVRTVLFCSLQGVWIFIFYIILHDKLCKTTIRAQLLNYSYATIVGPVGGYISDILRLHRWEFIHRIVYVNLLGTLPSHIGVSGTNCKKFVKFLTISTVDDEVIPGL